MKEAGSMKKLVVNPITSQLYNNIAKLKNWQETPLKKGQAIEKHAHGFDAMYFTKGVKKICCSNNIIELPDYAAVFVPRGTDHGWSGVAPNRKSAVVGHFHDGHGIHEIVSEY